MKARAILEDVLRSERLDSWPEDFQVILGDYLYDMGYEELPTEVPVKEVPVEPYLAQARAMGYSRSDARRVGGHRPAQGSPPPILIKGRTLVDGRHRLLALAPGTPSVRAIDLDDLKHV